MRRKNIVACNITEVVGHPLALRQLLSRMIATWVTTIGNLSGPSKRGDGVVRCTTEGVHQQRSRNLMVRTIRFQSEQMSDSRSLTHLILVARP